MLTLQIAEKTFQISPDPLVKGQFMVNNEHVSPNLVAIGTNKYHLVYNNASIELELVKQESGKYRLKVNGKTADVTLKTQLDMLLESLGLQGTVSNKISDLKAPMPGLILDIRVQAGQEIKKGDPLVVLEAMKMENIIKAAGNGVVKEVKITKGQKVEKNQVLLTF
jgi:biotin carboxyl carrier protein